ncbi:MAG: DUF2817 domain-containing protein [Betaproteobacteria bacterium]|nr:DUF2817 domain-containing protein [Betaproteobacteria bacterium]
MSVLAAFSENYPDARAKFLDAVRASGGAVTSYRHPGQKGPAGEDLYLDVAVIGPKDASRLMVAGCGTHGIEGFPGSASQTHWLATGGAQRLPPDTAVVFFHAHNPWGFAHRTRCTEENVDLNRNFVAFDSPRPANPGYREVHPNITPPDWDDATVAGIFRWLDEFRGRVGEQAFSDAYNGGQYSHADGVFYGGAHAQWANRALMDAVDAHLAHAKKVSFIDLHTGIGPFLDHIYICFHPAGSPAYERARDWWGERAVNRQGVTHKALADYKGILINELCAHLPLAETTAVVIEFGTRERREMQRAGMAGRWLQFEGQRDPAKAARVKADYVEAFYPADPRWRAAVLEQSRDFLDRALKGVSSS